MAIEARRRDLPDSVPGLYVSTELEDDELAARAAAPIIGVPWRDLLIQDRRRDIAAALAGRRVRVIGCDKLPKDGAGILALIRDAARVCALEWGVPPLLVVDYMQQIVRGEDPRNVRQKVGEVAGQLRALSQLLDCALVAVMSVSRSYYGLAKADKLREENDPEAYMAAAKESGDIDYDCAGILFLDVDKTAEGPIKPARIVVAKCRHGEVGFAGVRFDGALGKWTEDASALIELTKDHKKSKQEDERLEDAKRGILELVADKHKRGEAMNKNELVTGAGMQHKLAREAIDALLAERKLDVAGSRGLADKYGRRYPATAIVPVDAEPPKVERPPLDPTSIAAKFGTFGPE